MQERLAGRDPKPEKLQKDLDSILTGAGVDLEKYENPTLAQKIGQIPALEEELAYICKKAPEKTRNVRRTAASPTNMTRMKILKTKTIFSKMSPSWKIL